MSEDFSPELRDSIQRALEVAIEERDQIEQVMLQSVKRFRLLSGAIRVLETQRAGVKASQETPTYAAAKAFEKTLRNRLHYPRQQDTEEATSME